MKTYRCLKPQCASIFSAEQPVCAECNAGAEEITPVHYLVASADGPIFTGIGPRMLACNPTFAKLPKAATGERLAVTCPKCRESEIFKEDERDETDNDMSATTVKAKIVAEHGPALQRLVEGG